MLWILLREYGEVVPPFLGSLYTNIYKLGLLDSGNFLFHQKAFTRDFVS